MRRKQRLLGRGRGRGGLARDREGLERDNDDDKGEISKHGASAKECTVRGRGGGGEHVFAAKDLLL